MGDRDDSGETAPRPITDASEIRHYDEVAGSETKRADLTRNVGRVLSLKGAWGDPVRAWLDSVHDAAAQADVYAHLAPAVVGGTVVQIGGTGQTALKALAGGAVASVLVTPSTGEAELAREVAAKLGLADRFTALVGYAEDLPIESSSVTAVVSEGCLHHTDVAAVLNESARVLAPEGRFGAWDPWKARLYDLGIRVFGKRDPDVNCRPMEPSRVSSLESAFPRYSKVVLHGAVTRYPGIVWSRYVRPLSVASSLRMTRFDDRLSRHIGMLARNGSSCALLGTR